MEHFSISSTSWCFEDQSQFSVNWSETGEIHNNLTSQNLLGALSHRFTPRSIVKFLVAMKIFYVNFPVNKMYIGSFSAMKFFLTLIYRMHWMTPRSDVFSMEEFSCQGINVWLVAALQNKVDS